MSKKNKREIGSTHRSSHQTGSFAESELLSLRTPAGPNKEKNYCKAVLGCEAGKAGEEGKGESASDSTKYCFLGYQVEITE